MRMTGRGTNAIGNPNTPSRSDHVKGRKGILAYRLVRGAAADTNITVTGLLDELVAVYQLERSAAAPAAGGGDAIVDRTAESTRTSATQIQCSEATTGNNLLVVSRRDSAGR